MGVTVSQVSKARSKGIPYQKQDHGGYRIKSKIFEIFFIEKLNYFTCFPDSFELSFLSCFEIKVICNDR